MVVFDYIKASLFRVIHADGVLGGTTPGGGIHIGFFSERAPFPQREVYTVKANGTIDIPDRTVTRDALVREIDVDVMMSLQTAEALSAWLIARIDDLKSRPKAATSEELA